MNRPLRRGLTALTSLVVATGGLAVLGVSTVTPAQAADVAVTDATFAWDLNNEATSGAFAPNTWNLMSAGKIGDPGTGGQTLTTPSNGATWSNGEAAGWSAEIGNVTVEDLQAGGGYAPATFATTRTNTAGANANTSGVRGEIRLVFSEGTGTVDPEAGTAEISWDGDATLLFYSGMTFFYLSDPELTVTADGEGTVTATAGGYATSMENPDAWEALPDTEVTIATLSGVDVTEAGIAATPEYREVTYTAPPSAVPQVTTTANWGAFPQSFVDFQQTVGQGPYWYSTGGQADPRKVANPLEIDFNLVPAITVSDTDLLPSGRHAITVTGRTFDPTKAMGARPPLSGQPAGVYIAFGKFADTWRPSESAPSSSRKQVTADVAWATPNGVAPGTTSLNPDGTFTATVFVDKGAVDAIDPAFVGNYGIYVYPGSGAIESTFEVMQPITFTKATPALTITAPATRFGQAATAVVRVASDGGSDGSVTLKRGATTIGTKPLAGGAATFALGRPGAGAYPLTATYSGSDNISAGAGAGTLRVIKTTSTTALKVAKKPTRKKAGRAQVIVSSPTTAPAGKAKLQVKKGKRVVRTIKATLKGGKATVKLPRLAKGSYQVVATYAGSANVAASTKKSRFTVR